MLHLVAGVVPVPYPSFVNTGDNTWQITAATFVGLMSLPGLAVLYAAIVPKKWAVNVLAMMFAGFSLVLIAWVLWTYKMGFGATSLGHGVVNGVQTAEHGKDRDPRSLLRQLRRPAGSDHQQLQRDRSGGIGGEHRDPVPLPD